MKKSDIVNLVCEATGLKQRCADEVVSSFIEQVTNALARGESVNLVGFGSFIVRERAARSGRHPQTGAPLEIPAHKLPAFKPGKFLCEKVN